MITKLIEWKILKKTSFDNFKYKISGRICNSNQ